MLSSVGTPPTLLPKHVKAKRECVPLHLKAVQQYGTEIKIVGRKIWTYLWEIPRPVACIVIKGFRTFDLLETEQFVTDWRRRLCNGG